MEATAMTDRPTPPPLASFICRVRRQAGLSQTELADLLGVCQTAISHWERGVTEPYGGHLFALLVKLAPISTTALAAYIAQNTLT
jgi:transcriptional regulator with XRE-family HTH domain